ncbi:MAG: hypothetical protein ACR2PX_11775 [Endozoicomonas sp.]|uniref:hypothetical protein n=1 Tax=Endozoicomonas sp. TaxID=1892382 RepID=UPI003D9B314D
MSQLLQLKCLSDIRKVVSDIEVYRARPTIQGKHPTLYDERKEGRYRTVMGVRVCDFQFCPMSDGFCPIPIWGYPSPPPGIT